jgi:hypothetical protein
VHCFQEIFYQGAILVILCSDQTKLVKTEIEKNQKSNPITFSVKQQHGQTREQGHNSATKELLLSPGQDVKITKIHTLCLILSKKAFSNSSSYSFSITSASSRGKQGDRASDSFFRFHLQTDFCWAYTYLLLLSACTDRWVSAQAR